MKTKKKKRHTQPVLIVQVTKNSSLFSFSSGAPSLFLPYYRWIGFEATFARFHLFYLTGMTRTFFFQFRIFPVLPPLPSVLAPLLFYFLTVTCSKETVFQSHSHRSLIGSTHSSTKKFDDVLFAHPRSSSTSIVVFNLTSRSLSLFFSKFPC